MTVTEVPVSHTEAALQFLESLRLLLGTVPGFDIPSTRHSRLRGHRLLPDPFFDQLAVALESSPQFSAAVPLTAAEIRDMRRFGEAYLPTADALERFARGIRYTVAKRRAIVGRRALSAYRVAIAMNLLVDVSPPVPEVAAMKRVITTRRRRNNDTPQADTPTQASERSS